MRDNSTMDLARITAEIAELEGEPEPQIMKAIRREAAAINLDLSDAFVRAWAKQVHHGLGFRFN